MNNKYENTVRYYGLRRRPGPFGTDYRVYGPGDVNPFTELEVILAYLDDFHLPEIGIIGKSEIIAALFGILTYGIRTDKPFNMKIWNDTHLNPSTIEEEMRGKYSKFEIIYNHPNQAFLWPESPQVIFNDEGKPKEAIREVIIKLWVRVLGMISGGKENNRVLRFYLFQVMIIR